MYVCMCIPIFFPKSHSPYIMKLLSTKLFKARQFYPFIKRKTISNTNQIIVWFSIVCMWLLEVSFS